MSVTAGSLGKPAETAKSPADKAKPGERRKLVLVIGLGVVLAAMLAYQVPKLLGGSASPSATGAVPEGALTSAAAAAEAQATDSTTFRQRAASDPFVVSKSDPVREPTGVVAPPLSGKDPFASGVSSELPASTGAIGAPVKPPPVLTPISPSKPAVVKPVAPAKPVIVKPAEPVAPTKPVVTPVAAPTAAVIWANGHKRVIGLLEQFELGGTPFQLIALTKETAKIGVVLGGFKGGAQTIAIARNEIVTLTDVATGVQYVLNFTVATSAKSASGTVTTKADGK